MGSLGGALELQRALRRKATQPSGGRNRQPGVERGTLRFTLYGESLGAVPSSGQPARRVLFSLCLVCMHVFGWMVWKGVEGARTPPTPRTFTCIKSKRLSVDREGRSLVPMVCGLAIMDRHGCLAHPPTFMRAAAAEAAGSREGDRGIVPRS